jgi:plasmid stabilization system protein ParE
MPQLIWSPAALRDVDRLYRFLADKNPEAARRAAKSIREAMKIMRDQPGIGRPIADMEPDFREWLIPFGDSGYVSLYRFNGETAVMLAVRHQR